LIFSGRPLIIGILGGDVDNIIVIIIGILMVLVIRTTRKISLNKKIHCV
jgi:hypothetical protein